MKAFKWKNRGFIRNSLKHYLIVIFRTDDVGEMLSKVAEVMPNWIEVKTVVGIKYIKMLDKKLDPNLIESTCAEKIKSLKPTNPIKT